MARKQMEKKDFHVPSRGVVDDRNTLESQIVGVHPQSHRHPLSSRTVQIKKYLPRYKNLL